MRPSGINASDAVMASEIEALSCANLLNQAVQEDSDENSNERYPNPHLKSHSGAKIERGEDKLASKERDKEIRRSVDAAIESEWRKINTLMSGGKMKKRKLRRKNRHDKEKGLKSNYRLKIMKCHYQHYIKEAPPSSMI